MALFRSSCSSLVSATLLMVLFSLVSSAKLDATECWIQELISFRYSMKKMGPRTVPCGTPEITLDGIDDFPFMTTVCFLLERYDVIQAKSFPLIP